MSDPFDACMETFRAEFKAGLAAHDMGVADDWSLTGDEHTRTDALRRLVRRAHRLSGTAATFGFADIGNAAEALEVALEAGLAAEPKDIPARIETLVDALRAAIATARA